MKQSLPLARAAKVRSRFAARARGRVCRLVAVALSVITLAACAVPGAAVKPLTADRQVVVEGQVVSVDASPMAYDGDALVVLDSESHGPVTVHLPARTNLCRAQGLGLLGELRIGDRLQVEGLATGPGDITVCQEPSHRLQRID